MKVVTALTRFKDAKTGKILGYEIMDDTRAKASVKIHILKEKIQSGELEITNLKIDKNNNLRGAHNKHIPTIIIYDKQFKRKNSTDINSAVSIEEYNDLVAELEKTRTSLSKSRREAKELREQIKLLQKESKTMEDKLLNIYTNYTIKKKI